MMEPMAALPTPAANPAAGRFGTLVTVALVLVLAWVLAKWTWVFVAPPVSASAAPAGPGVDLAAVARLFGGAAPSGTASPAASSSGLRLKGVIAPTPADIGSAVFNAGGRDVAVALGGEVQPGVKLVAVEPDHAVVSRAGVRERIDLEARMAPVPRPVAGKASGFRLAVSRSGSNSFSFSRKDLENALKDPGQLAFLGRIGMPQGGGVRLDEAPPGSLAARLGLQPGDVIRKVNGQPVASAGDLARLHQQFATTSLVQAEIQRGTATVQLSYNVNP
jgi:general secretion pathway protein C